MLTRVEGLSGRRVPLGPCHQGAEACSRRRRQEGADEKGRRAEAPAGTPIVVGLHPRSLLANPRRPVLARGGLLVVGPGRRSTQHRFLTHT